MTNIRKQKSIIASLMALVIFISMSLGTLKTKAADEVTAYINIYVNGTYTASDVVTESEIGELYYGTLPIGYLYGDAYGSYESVSMTVNGVRNPYTFCFDGGENVNFFKPDFSDLTPDDELIINLYYKNDQAPAPVEYGVATFDVAYSNGKPAEGQEFVLTGTKGADTISRTVVSDAKGLAVAQELDMSYNWMVQHNGYNYEVEFEDGEFYSQFMAPSKEAPVEEEKKEQKEELAVLDVNYQVTVLFQLSSAPGGKMVDGVASNAVYSAEKGFIAAAGTIITEDDLLALVPSDLELIDPSTIIYQGDTFILGSEYKSMAGLDTNETSEGIILKGDLTATYNYTFKAPVYGVTVNYLDAATGEKLLDSRTNTYTGSSTIGGPKTYDVTDAAPGYYGAYGLVKGYTYTHTQGDALTGELDGDKEISFMYTKDEVVPPAEEEPEVPVNPEPPAEEEPELPVNPEPTDPEEPEVPEKPEPETPEPVKPEPETPEPEDPETEDKEIPVTPETPKTPDEPQTPEVPKEPVVPKTPETPEVPETPVPETPETPAAPEAPAPQDPAPVEPAPQVETPERPVSQAQTPENLTQETTVEEPAIVPAVTTENTPAEPAAPVEEAKAAEEILEVEEEAVPLAAAPVAEIIAEEPAPLAASRGAWALVNLILTIVAVLTAVGMMITYFKKKEDEEEEKNDAEQEDEKKRKASKFFGLIPAVAAVIIFILTEKMRLPMVLTDRWTLLMAIVAIAGLLLAYFTRNKKEEEEEQLQAAEA